MSATEEAPPAARKRVRCSGVQVRAEEKGKDRARDEDCLPTSVVRVLVENDFLGAAELGRIRRLSRSLAARGRTSRTTTGGSDDDDDLWSCLCRRRFPNTAEVPPALIEREGGYRGWYRKRLEVTVEPPKTLSAREALPPPDLRLDDLMLLVDLAYCGTSVVSRTLTGDDLRPFLENGRVDLDVEEPVELGTLLPTWPLPEDERFGGTDTDYGDGDGELVVYDTDSWRIKTKDGNNEGHKFEALVHLVHLSEKKECCFLHETADDSCYAGECHVRNYEDTTTTNDYSFSDDEKVLRLKGTANHLLERIVDSRADYSSGNRTPRPSSLFDKEYIFRNDFELPKFYCNMYYTPELLPAEECSDGSFKACEKLDSESNRVIVRLLGVVVELHYRLGRNFEGLFREEEEKTHHVTILHLLDHLDWS